MAKYDPYKKKKQVKCDVCKYQVFVDDAGNGDPCPICGWIQNEDAADHPYMVRFMNPLSLNRAKKLYKEGKPFKADFDEFIEAFDNYGEMQFHFNKIRFGLYAPNDVITLIQFELGDEVGHSGNPHMVLGTFKDLEEFREKANINGVLLKDLWDEVENPYWLQ